MGKVPDGCLAFTNREAWRAWLAENYTANPGVWLLINRKAAPRQFLMLEEAVEEALCFGWIDGTLQPISKETYALRFSPRQPNSIWSVNNQRRVAKLIEEGRMTPAGLAKIAAAKQSGEWEAALARKDVSSVPDELVQALEEGDAWLAFERWPYSKKMHYLYWLESAIRLETRQKRIQAILELAKRGQK